ncbi:MAG: MlaD family protein [Phycisphaerae bacterium]|nr:MlaD family protein [Phycisphaerae bacterium]MDD5380096.1 MlaD family protein [Phycisphaerae bacterium]
MSDYETAQRRRNIVVGIFVVVAICAIVWLIFMFNDFPTVVSKLSSFQVFVQFPTAPGVVKDTPVRFCGYPIGSVTKVMPPQIREDLNTGLKYHQTVVVLSINKKYANIPSNIKVKLMTRGLGSSYIELAVDPTLPLVQRDPNRPETAYLVDKMLLQGSTGMTSEFFPEESQKKLDELANSLTVFINNANEIVGDKANKENIKTTLANLSVATEDLKKLLASGVGTSEEINKTSAELRLILEKINSGQGTTGKLINDARLYEKLLENSDELEVLLKDLREMVAEYRKKGIKVKLK